MPELRTLPDDIYALFNPDEDHQCNEDNLDAFANGLKDILRQRLKKYTPPTSPLRFSSLGKPDRQLWYEAHPEPGTKEAMVPKTYIKFLYGDIIEAMLLFLAKEAGHEVTDEQKEIVVDSVAGHIDARIDGTIVDVKSASPFGYKKFEDETVPENDAFGYVEQLSGYSNTLNPGEDAAWLAFDKVSGDICISTLPHKIMKHYQPQDMIDHKRKVVESEEVPPLCAEPVPEGSSGNMRLPTTPCGYCAHKRRCHPGLRTFLYSNGPKFLTTVAKLPNVPELTDA